ncbi:hypothetical protein KI387_030519, partial [Taxus chinensis]
APPKFCDEINDVMDSKKLNIKEEKEMDIERHEQRDNITSIQTLDKENQLIGKVEHEGCKDRESGIAIEQMKDMPNRSECLDKAKQDVGKQPSRGTGKNVKADSRAQRGERS